MKVRILSAMEQKMRPYKYYLKCDTTVYSFGVIADKIVHLSQTVSDGMFC